MHHMDLSGIIQLAATLVEIVIACISFLIAWKRKKQYGYFIGITFALFVLFDLSRIFSLEVSAERHALVLLVACLSMAWAMWLLWKET